LELKVSKTKKLTTVKTNTKRVEMIIIKSTLFNLLTDVGRPPIPFNGFEKGAGFIN